MGYKCDKCGKEVEYIKYIPFPCHYSYTVDLADGKDFYNYELCKDCYEKVVKTIKEITPATKTESFASQDNYYPILNQVISALTNMEYVFITLTDVDLSKLKQCLEHQICYNKIIFSFTEDGKYKATFKTQAFCTDTYFELIGNVLTKEAQIRKIPNPSNKYSF